MEIFLSGRIFEILVHCNFPRLWLDWVFFWQGRFEIRGRMIVVDLLWLRYGIRHSAVNFIEQLSH